MLKNRLYIIILFILIHNYVVSQDHENISLANEYFNMGELNKARELYEKLARNSKNIPIIHDNYFELMISLGEFIEAEKYIDKRIKENPENLLYHVDKGFIYSREGLESESAEYFTKLFFDIKKDDHKTRIVASYLIKKQMLGEAERLYMEARKASNDTYYFAIELANVYRIMNIKDKMVLEYLNFVTKNPRNINYVKNVFQNLLTQPEDLEDLENLLYDKIQKDPSNDIYNEMLIWVNIQQRNFYGAFIQARAYEKKKDLEGSKILEVGMISLENRDYNTAIEVFDYLENSYKEGYIYPIAKRYKIKAREELVKETYPVDKNEIRKLAEDYNRLIKELGINANTAEALRSKANLHAFYLDERDSAILIHNRIINIARIKPDLKARCKLDLGDIYLMSNEPWESTLLYSQVEKSMKDTPIGYEAKLKNAKLSYYKGDFALAQEHLDILKLATTREISNDAIALSTLIKDNTILDTSDVVLNTYARIELLLFQNKHSQAIDSLTKMYHDYNGHSLSDEVLWLLANTYMEIGAFEKSIENLELIVENYSDDIISDDAYYRIGIIYEIYLKDLEKAQAIYNDLLVKYPGSIYVADARKRYRRLRGDFIN